MISKVKSNIGLQKADSKLEEHRAPYNQRNCAHSLASQYTVRHDKRRKWNLAGNLSLSFSRALSLCVCLCEFLEILAQTENTLAR